MSITPERSAAFAEGVLNRYADSVYRLALARTRHRESAEDIVQEVFLALMERKEPFESEEHLKAWLLRVAINRCGKLFASGWFRKTEPLTEDFPAQTPEDSGVLEEMEKMSKTDRTILYLYYYEDYNLLEIAGMLHQKETTVRSRLFRARNRLRKRLGGVADEG